ncbi:MAG: replicative DNA helicase [Patescibacteria group bacterium]
MSKLQEIIEKLPPQSIEAEQSLLGCLMIDKNAIVKVADFLKIGDFYKGIHQKIYDTCIELFEKGEPIDLLSVSGKLKDKNLLETIGGNAYLTELINSVPTASHVLSYAKTIQKKRILRDLISASQELGQMGYNEDEDVNNLLDQAEKKIFSIAQKGFTHEFILIKDDLDEALQRIHNLKSGGTMRGVPTGFKDLDNMLAGLQKSDLIILAARPSLGKSALAVNVAANIAMQQNIPVGIFSLEMSRDQIVDRLISSVANIDLWKLRTGHLSDSETENDTERIQHAISILDKAPIYIDDSSGTNAIQMKAMARRLQMEKGLGLIVIDYLQLMDSITSDDDPVHQVSLNSKALKGMAKELNIPVLVLSQLSRAVEQRSPQIPRLADLRQSGTIEQDADVVLFIYREDKYVQDDSAPKGVARIIISKHRNGPVGQVELYFDERTVSFKSLEKGFMNEQF